MSWLGRKLFPESRERKRWAQEKRYQDLMSVFHPEERERYRSLAFGEGLASANTAALDEMEAVAAIRLYEQARKMDRE